MSVNNWGLNRSLISLLLGDWIYKIKSKFIVIILRLKGMKVGKNFYIQGTPRLKIRGKAKNIIISNDVSICGDIDLRNGEIGKIIIEDNVYFDHNSHFVAANNATIRIKSNTAIGPNCIFNAGEDVTIGKRCFFSGNIYLNSSDHNIKKGKFIRQQGYNHAPIVIEDDCFFGGHVSSLQGVHIKKGAVVGGNAVVTKDLPSNSISAGIPAKAIKNRE